MSAVWAHSLAGSDSIARAAPRVENELLGLLGQPAGRVDLNVNPACGWITALVRDAFAARRHPALPTATEARKRAEQFVRDLARRLAPGPELPLAFVPPLPSDPLELASVPHPYAPEWNHWIYRTQPRLPISRVGGSAPILGSAIEVRIGEGGRTIGYHARWRPTTGERLSCTSTAAPNHEVPQEHSSNDEHAATSPISGRRLRAAQQVYVLDGVAVPQPYLALYHLLDAGHHFHLASACNLALLVDLEVSDTEDGTTVRAVTTGGSGHYRYSWSRMSAADPFDGLRILGGGATVQDRDRGTTSAIVLEKAFHLIMVHVVDTKTGAFKHHQQHVVSSPFSRRVEAPFAVPDSPRQFVQVRDPEDPR